MSNSESNRTLVYASLPYDRAPSQQASQTDRVLDIYRPDSKSLAKNAPVVLMIHGGAWHIGHRDSLQPAAIHMAKQGYVCVLPAYSLSFIDNAALDAILTLFIVILFLFALTSQSLHQFILLLAILAIGSLCFVLLTSWLPQQHVQHPDHIEDVAMATAWVQRYIHQYQGDEKQLVIMGHSAGAHLASLLCTNQRYLIQAGADPTMIKGCVCLSGVYSDVRLQETTMGEKLLFSSFGKRTEFYDCFPIYHTGLHNPPFLLINAGHDISLKRHTLDFHYSLKQQGVYVKSIYYPDRVHLNIHLEWGNKQRNHQVWSDIDQFLQLCLT